MINEEKNLNKKLVSSFGIASVENAADEFTATKLNAAVSMGTDLEVDLRTGKLKSLELKQLETGNKILAHHVIQSFSPDDRLSPEEIHEIGRKTCLLYTSDAADD